MINETALQATEETPVPATPVTGSESRLHLGFLDGIRGVSAFYVLLFHIFFNYRDDLPPVLKFLTGWMQFGVLAVSVFIVLSGYCLMLPVARSAAGNLRGGALDYLKRRARRILPPYYAALFFSILLAFLLPSVWRVPALSPGNLTLHLLVLHNLSEVYSQSRLNPPMWSVAMEWEIYFLFPLILLPVWRKFGSLAAVLTGFALGALPHYLLPKSQNLDWTEPWFIGLFAMGMAGAVLTCRREAKPKISGAGWGWLSLFFAILTVGFCFVKPSLHSILFFIAENMVVAAAAVCFLLYSVHSERRPLLTRLLEHRWLALLGTFSYSLYLTHGPLVLLMYNGLQTMKLSASASFCLMLLTAAPLCVAISYVFHVVFERRFLSAPVRQAEEKALHPAA